MIVGYPNVGKSSLFNRLLKRRRSLVHSLPGMTRDQIEALCAFEGRECILIDTGGFFDLQEEPLSSQIKDKAWQASRKAEMIVFVLDAKRELLPAEKELFFLLKKLGKKMFVVVNKVDNPAEEEKLGDFFTLGEEKIYPLSAEHKRNIELLEEALAGSLPPPVQQEKEVMPLKIAIIGRINVGKSSIVNRLCGEERLVISHSPGTTRDSTDTLITRGKKHYCLVDTAGIRRLSRTRDEREKASIIKAKKDIRAADVICLILDAQEFPTRQDTAVAHLARDSGKPLLIALNKWDLIEKGYLTTDEIRTRVYHKLEFVSYAPLIFISALTGKRVVKILDIAEEVHANACKRIETSCLNRFLTSLTQHHPPLSKNRRKFKVKYITQKGILPPTFLLFTHSKAGLAPSYEKFLVNRLREEFDFWGTPLRLVLRRDRGK